MGNVPKNCETYHLHINLSYVKIVYYLMKVTQMLLQKKEKEYKKEQP